MTGTAWIDDYGLLLYPITITNTNSVGVRDAVIEWGRTRVPGVFNCCLPTVAETWEGDLNDIYGFHVHKEHVRSTSSRPLQPPSRDRLRRGMSEAGPACSASASRAESAPPAGYYLLKPAGLPLASWSSATSVSDGSSE